tara:strand:- start:12 stop:494 length:483 start_codon:yes stop_codon:yes gene_type:complete
MQVTDEMIKKAEEWNEFKSNKFTAKKNNPIKQRELTVIGNLAEIVFYEKYKDSKRISDTDYNADFILKNKRVDVKVKLGNEYLKPFYEVSIQASQKMYDVDWYAFYHYNRRKKDINFLGWISKKDFFIKANLKRQGDIYKNNNHKIENDVYQLKISELTN